jgi:D-alanyl-lipoteichoic acid acyltransferase DltB (MBOAT superfamily)
VAYLTENGLTKVDILTYRTATTVKTSTFAKEYICMVFLSTAFLLPAILGFYAWSEPGFVFIMPLSIVANRALALARREERRRRWHLSLCAWFCDYADIPLDGSRCGSSRCGSSRVVTLEGWL